MNENELYHYGVKGMKWGVRTSVYTKNRLGDTYTDRERKKMTSDATKVLKRDEKRYRAIADSYDKAADRNYKRADKHVWTSERAQAKGNQQKFEKYQGKAWKQLAKQYENIEKAKILTSQANIVNKKMSDINSGKLKAGKDFVTNTTYSTNLLLDAVGIYNISRSRNLEFRD